MADIWVATAPIYLNDVLAYMPHDVVPDSATATFGLDSEGLVVRRTVDDAGFPTHGVHLVTDDELEAALAGLGGGTATLPATDTDREKYIPGRLSATSLKAAFGSAGGSDFPLPQQASSDAQIASVVLADTDPTSPADGLTFTRLDGTHYEFGAKTEAEWRPWFGDGGKHYLTEFFGAPAIAPGVNGDSQGAFQWVTRCRTNSPWLLMRSNYAGSGIWDGTIHIRVNGVPIWDKPRDLGGTWGGAPGNLEVRFLDSSWKTVEIFHTCNRVLSLNWAAGSTTTAWAPTGQKKLAVLGDSWARGTEQAGVTGSYARALQRRVSWDVSYNGQGGTGYVAGGTDNWFLRFGHPPRLATLTDAHPDVLVVVGSINDRGQASVQAAAAHLYADVATASPATKIVVVGAQLADDGGTAVNTALAAAAAAAPNVLGFVDPVAERWVLPGVTGPADFIHPSALGAEYLAHKVEQAVRRLTVAAGDTSW